MRIFIDIGHPAHVHYFKNTVLYLKKNGHDFLITAREKDVTHQLLNNYKISFVSRGKGRDGLLGKFFYLLKANYQLYHLGKGFKPDLFISFSSPYAAQVSTILKIPHIAFTDTEHAKLGILAFLPFSNYVITPKVYKNDLGKKHIRFDGYMEQSYLQNDFNPKIDTLKKLKLTKNQKFVIIRLVAWKASHDIGQQGFGKDTLMDLVNSIEKYARIFILSEGEIPQVLKKYELKINPIEIHNLLYYAILFIGEGATMASECAILGTPSIYINTLSAGTLEDQEKKGLLHIFNSPHGVKNKALELLGNPKIKSIQRKKCFEVMQNKIDVNRFIQWLILGYPHSAEKLRIKPELQYSIK